MSNRLWNALKRRRAEAEIVDLEYDPQCPQCTTAEWYVWASHNATTHKPQEAPACHIHHELVEQCTVRRLRENWTCPCGFVATGQLSDHFRSVKL